jgi:kynurenine formamidase
MAVSEQSATDTNWGRWGAEDERGTLNLLTPEVVLNATKVCKTGKVYNLGLPIQKEGMPILDYRGAPQRLTLMNHGDPGMFDAFGAAPDVGANEDILVMASHTITHMDALCHVFKGGKIYNGFDANSFRTNTGAGHLGIEKVQAIAGRAILLDLPGHMGVDWLEPGHKIMAAELEACAKAQGTEVRSGDIALIRTGYLDQYFSLSAGEQPMAQPGIGVDAVSFIRDHDIAAVGCDNSAVEVIPFDEDVFLNVHIELLVKLGVPMLEHLMLKTMATDKAYESLLVVAPLLVTGASGSPINPVAIA